MGALHGGRRRVRGLPHAGRSGILRGRLGLGRGPSPGGLARRERRRPASAWEVPPSRLARCGNGAFRGRARLLPLRGWGWPPARGGALRGLRWRRRPGVRGRARLRAARIPGGRRFVGAGSALVLLQPKDRRHARAGQLQEGAAGARLFSRALVRSARLGRGVLARDIVRFGACAQGWQDGAGGDAPGTHRFGLSLGSGLATERPRPRTWCWWTTRCASWVA